MKDNSDKNLKKELLDLEKQYWTALKDRDVETVTRLSADECIVTGAQGVGAMKKESVAGMVEKATYELRDFQIEDARVQRLADDVAILAYKVHEELVVDGAAVSLDAPN